MADWSYEQEHVKLTAELDNLVEQRIALDAERMRVYERMKVVLKAMAALEELMGMDNRADVAAWGTNVARQQAMGLRVSDKIRFVLSDAPGPLTAREIMSRLADLGFKFEGDPRPLATIHSICHRLVTAKQPVIAEAPSEGSKAWRWIGQK